MKKILFVPIIFILFLAGACLTGGTPEITPIITPSQPTNAPILPDTSIDTSIPPSIASLDKEIDQVWRSPSGKSDEQVWNTAPISVGDKVWTQQQGHGLLKYSDMWLRIYDDSGMHVDECATSDICWGVDIGAFLGSGVYHADRHIQISTDNSRVMITATTFMVAYFPERRLTLVRVFNGQSEVLNSQGVTQSSFVNAGQWALVQADQPPQISDNLDELRQLTDDLGMWNQYYDIEQDVLNQFGPAPVPREQVTVAYYSKEGLEFETARTGPSYAEIGVENPQDCRQACLKDQGKCLSFNFIKDQNVCQLMEGAAAGESNTCCVSGIAGKDLTPPSIENVYSEPALEMVCSESISSIKVYSTITDLSGVSRAFVDYRVGDGSWSSVEMTREGSDAFSSFLNDLRQGLFSFKVRAEDIYGNQNESQPQTFNIFSCEGIDPGTDRPGGVWQEFYAESPQACRQACQNNSDCTTFSYIGSQNQCRFMKGEPLPQKDSCCFSGVVRPDTVPPYISNVQYSPTDSPVCTRDYSQLKVSSAISDLSGVAEASLWYLFIPPSGIGSWTKIPMQESSGIFSAVLDIPGGGELMWYIEALDVHKNTNRTEKYRIIYQDCEGLQFGVDLPDPQGVELDMDFSYATANDPQACRKRCMENPYCYAFTYRPSDGACWLKSGEPLPINSSAYISGVVIDDQTAPNIQKVQSSQPEVPDYVCEASSASVHATVIDPSSVDRVELWIYKETTGGPWQKIPMTLGDGTKASGTYWADFNAPEMGIVRYKVVAIDIHGNSAESSEHQINFTLC